MWSIFWYAIAGVVVYVLGSKPGLEGFIGIGLFVAWIELCVKPANEQWREDMRAWRAWRREKRYLRQKGKSEARRKCEHLLARLLAPLRWVDDVMTFKWDRLRSKPTTDRVIADAVEQSKRDRLRSKQ